MSMPMFHELTMWMLIKDLIEGLRAGFYWLLAGFYSPVFSSST